jgi:hypothetical protein
MFSNIRRCSLRLINTTKPIKRTKRSVTEPSHSEELQTQNIINEMLQRRSNTSNNNELLKQMKKRQINMGSFEDGYNYVNFYSMSSDYSNNMLYLKN